MGRAYVRPDQELAHAVGPRRELDLDGDVAMAVVQATASRAAREVTAIERPASLSRCQRRSRVTGGRVSPTAAATAAANGTGSSGPR